MNRCSALEAILWLRWVVSGPSPRTSGFSTSPGHVGCVVVKVSQTDPPPPPSTSIFSYHYHSTNAARSFTGQESTEPLKHGQDAFMFPYRECPYFHGYTVHQYYRHFIIQLMH